MQPIDLFLTALLLLAVGAALRAAWRRRGRCCGDCSSCAGSWLCGQLWLCGLRGLQGPQRAARPRPAGLSGRNLFPPRCGAPLRRARENGAVPLPPGGRDAAKKPAGGAFAGELAGRAPRSRRGGESSETGSCRLPAGRGLPCFLPPGAFSAGGGKTVLDFLRAGRPFLRGPFGPFFCRRNPGGRRCRGPWGTHRRLPRPCGRPCGADTGTSHGHRDAARAPGRRRTDTGCGAENAEDTAQRQNTAQR